MLKNTKILFQTATSKHYKIIAIGGGAGGLGFTSKLLSKKPELKNNILIIEPSEKHYYQPSWTLVGGGLFNIENSVKETKELIPEHTTWVKDYVSKIDPQNNKVILSQSGEEYTYDYLLATPGLQIKYDKVKGLKEALDDPESPVSTNYDFRYAGKTFKNLQKLSAASMSEFGGKKTAVFTQPLPPIKCGGAPQKIMYLVDSHIRKNGNRDNVDIKFFSGGPGLFPVKKYSDVLVNICKERNLQTNFTCSLIEINQNTAIFEKPNGEKFEQHFDFLHVTPPQGPHKGFESISNEAGWIDVDAGTCQHKVYKNVFSVGDASSLPTSKTASALTKQIPIAVSNMISVMNGKEPTEIYDGYTGCPIPVDDEKLLMAEFDYKNEPAETLSFLGQGQPRSIFFQMKLRLFPRLYWNGILKGKWRY